MELGFSFFINPERLPLTDPLLAFDFVIDCEGTFEQILFYAFKIQFHPVARHEIRNWTRRGQGRFAF
jgi:hypothetical protein